MGDIEYYRKSEYSSSIRDTALSVQKGNQLRGRKALVTGASGLVGSYLSDVLMELESIVYVAGRNTEKLQTRFPGAHPLTYDLSSEIMFNESFDYIIHCAGYGHPRAFVDDPEGILLNSVLGTKRLLGYAEEHNVKRFLYISSGEVYGDIDSMTSRACYPLGKQAGENLCAIYKDKHQLDTVVARLCHTFGPGISDNDNRATAQFFRAALANKDIILKSKGEQLRSYLYVADSVSAILTVLLSGESGKAYDIASDECVITIANLARTIAEVAGVEVRFEIPNEDEKRQQSPISKQVLNGDSLRELKWAYRYSIDEGCRETMIL